MRNNQHAIPSNEVLCKQQCNISLVYMMLTDRVSQTCATWSPRSRSCDCNKNEHGVYSRSCSTKQIQTTSNAIFFIVFLAFEKVGVQKRDVPINRPFCTNVSSSGNSTSKMSASVKTSVANNLGLLTILPTHSTLLSLSSRLSGKMWNGKTRQQQEHAPLL